MFISYVRKKWLVDNVTDNFTRFSDVNTTHWKCLTSTRQVSEVRIGSLALASYVA